MADIQSHCDCAEPPLDFPWFPWWNNAPAYNGWGPHQIIHLIAEGAANVVYRISLPPDHPSYPYVQGRYDENLASRLFYL